MKRILALMLALSLVFAFAACKKTDKEDETKAPETEIVTNEDGEEMVVPAETEAEEATNAEGEVVTDAEEATEAETNAAGKPAASNPAAKPEANKPVAGKMDAAALASFLNAETAKIAKANKYNVNRNCSYTKNINVGDKTEKLEKLIKSIDSTASLSSVVGGFLGIGTNSGAPSKVDSNYRIKATALKASDIQMVSASETKYVFKLANAKNPQKDNKTPLSRFTNDFITAAEVQQGLKDAAKGLIKLTNGDVSYTNITVTVTVANGKITGINYSYNFDAVLDLSAVGFKIHGTGAAKTTGSFSGINY